MKRKFKKILFAVIALPTVGIALILAHFWHEDYQSEKVVKTALACDLTNAQQNRPDAIPTTWNLLIGPRSSEVPNELLHAIYDEASVNTARDLQLANGQSRYESPFNYWNFDGAYYHVSWDSELKAKGDKYLIHTVISDYYDHPPDEIDRRTLTYIVITLDEKKIVRQCRAIEPKQAHGAVKAEQAKVPQNKI